MMRQAPLNPHAFPADMDRVVRKTRLRLKGFPNGIVALHRSLVALGYEAKLVQRNIHVLSNLSWLQIPAGYKKEQTQVAIRLGNELFSFSNGTVSSWGSILVGAREHLLPGNPLSEAYFTSEEQPFSPDPQSPNAPAGLIHKIMDAIETRQTFESQLKKKPQRRGERPIIPFKISDVVDHDDYDPDGLFDIVEEYRQQSKNSNLKPLLVTLLHFLSQEKSQARLIKRTIGGQSEQCVFNGERIALEYGHPTRLVCLNARNGWNRLTEEELVKYGDVTPFMAAPENASHYLKGFEALNPRVGVQSQLFSLLEKRLLEETIPTSHATRQRRTL